MKFAEKTEKLRIRIERSNNGGSVGLADRELLFGYLGNKMQCCLSTRIGVRKRENKNNKPNINLYTSVKNNPDPEN